VAFRTPLLQRHPVATADGRLVAWVTVRCPETLDRSIGAVHRARMDGSGEVTHPVGVDLANVVGFLGRRVVYNSGYKGGAWITDFRGYAKRIPGVDRVEDVRQSTGWFIGARGDGARLVVDAHGTVRWRLGAGYLVAFSPDGSKVLAAQTRRQVSVLHARDGSTAASVDLPAGVAVFGIVWETNRTLLTLMRHNEKVAVVRFRLDGRLERTTPAVHVDDGQFPYVMIPRS
jgi:hypothetical protein